MGRNNKGVIVKYLFLCLMFLFSFSSVFAYTGKVMVGDVGAEVDPGIKVIYDIFRGEGDTTDFLYMTDMELSMIGSLTLEKLDYGKIILAGITNLTKDVSGDLINLSANVEFRDKYIFVNSEALTSFQAPVLISFRNIFFDNPLVLRNNETCGEYCTEISYVDDVYTFGVNNFSSYEVIEDPNPSTTDPDDDDAPSSGGGGGGGGGDSTELIPVVDKTLEESLVFSEESITLNVKKGVYFRKKISVYNNGSESLSVGILINNLTSFVFPSDRFFDIAPGEIRELNFDFYFSRNQNVGVYFGEISFFSGPSIKKIKTVLNVNIEDSLFDVFVNVSGSRYSPMNDVVANISIYNIGKANNVPATMFYAIRDVNNNTMASGSEEIIIRESFDITRSLNLPIKALSGDYLFYVLVSYDGGYAVSSDYFYVSSNWFYEFWGSKQELGISLAFFLIFTLVMLGWMIVKYQKSKNESLEEKSESESPKESSV